MMSIPNRTLLIRGIKLACAGHLFFAYFYYPQETIGPSMLPTLEVGGDVVLISAAHRRGHRVRAGDVVSARHPEAPGEGLCKRVLGMPGDFVCVGDVGRVEGELEGPRRGGREARKVVQIPEGHCWLAGDNTPWSKDSRDYGPLPLGLIKGKVVARIWPLTRMKRIENGFSEV